MPAKYEITKVYDLVRPPRYRVEGDPRHWSSSIEFNTREEAEARRAELLAAETDTDTTRRA